jgi:hypothetical protein
MNQNTYMKLTGTIFLIIAVAHLLRAVLGWNVVIGTTVIPLWISWIGVIVAGCLSYQGLSKR